MYKVAVRKKKDLLLVLSKNKTYKSRLINFKIGGVSTTIQFFVFNNYGHNYKVTALLAMSSSVPINVSVG